MMKLVVDNSKPRPTLVAVTRDPQEELDAVCARCFLFRGYYLKVISQNKPFDLQRAADIMAVLSAKGAQDPKSYALAHSVRLALLAFK